jgi:predicted molibdopterin-dependent oxidoreductase YjgC
MRTESLFRKLPAEEPGDQHLITIDLDGQPLQVPQGLSVAAALLLSGLDTFHPAAVSGTARAPYCMMGVCFECLVEIDGQPNQQACLVTVRDGMKIASMRTPQLAGLAKDEVLHD